MPCLSRGIVVKRRKPTRAQQEAQASFDAMMLKWATVPKFARRPVSNIAPVSVPKTVTCPPGREPEPISRPSESSFKDKWVGGTKPVHALRYTGDKLVGIGVMHKSNSVPVFNSDQAVDLARMRRG
jgi:hypothetical protein